MIHVERKKGTIPDILVYRSNSEAEKEYFLATIHYGQSEVRRRQKRFDFTLDQHPSVKKALFDLFSGKCAYCDSKMVITEYGVGDDNTKTRTTHQRTDCSKATGQRRTKSFIEGYE